MGNVVYTHVLSPEWTELEYKHSSSIFKSVAKLRYVLENQQKKSEHIKLMECFLPSSLEYFVVSLVWAEGDGKC